MMKKITIFLLTALIIMVSIGGITMIWLNKKSDNGNSNEKSITPNPPIKEIKPYTGDDIASHDTPVDKEVVEYFKGKEGGRLESDICTEEPTYIGTAFSKEEQKAFFDKNEQDILEDYYFVSHKPTTVEISKNGFCVLPLEKERHNIIVADILAYPIKEVETGKWVGTLDVYRYEDEIRYQVSGDGLDERVQEKLKQNYSGELVAVCKYYNFYVIITPDQQVYGSVYGLGSKERKKLFSKLTFDDYYSFFLTNYNKANFDFS